MPGIMMSKSSRSGAFLSTARSAASPSRATLSLNSPRKASTSMSTLALTSSTTSTRHSDRSFMAMTGSDPLLHSCTAQRLEGTLELVGADELREAGVSLRTEEPAEQIAVALEPVDAAGSALLQQPRPAADRRLERGRVDRGRGSHGGRRCSDRLAKQWPER